MRESMWDDAEGGLGEGQQRSGRSATQQEVSLGGPGKDGGGSGQRKRWSGQRLGGLCRALHVVWRRLQVGWRRRGVVEDAAMLAETGGDGGGRVGRGAGPGAQARGRRGREA